MSKKNKKGGRKNAYETVIKPNLETIKTMKERGIKTVKICEYLGIKRNTYYKYLRQEKEFQKAVAEGEVQIDNKMFDAYIKKGLEGDTKILIHYAEAKLGLKATKEVEKKDDELKIEIEVK